MRTITMGGTLLPDLDAEVVRVQSTLCGMLDGGALTLDAPSQGGTVQPRVGGETVGTTDAVSDEDGRSWVLAVVGPGGRPRLTQWDAMRAGAETRVASMGSRASDVESDSPETFADATIMSRRVSRCLPGLFASVGAAMVVTSVATLSVPSEATATALLGSTALLPVLVGVGFVAERMGQRSVEGARCPVLVP